MPAYWFTFKPLSSSAPNGWPIEDMRDLVSRFAVNPDGATEWWNIAAHNAAKVGDRAYLFKQGEGKRGVFGVGTIVDGPEFRTSTAGKKKESIQAKIHFEQLVDPTKDQFLLNLNDISAFIPPNLIAAQGSGTTVPEEAAKELESRLVQAPQFVAPPLDGQEADDSTLDPESFVDDRERALRAIRIRRGQPAFRNGLLEAYGKRCVVTGCTVVDVLEAAHIIPYKEKPTIHVNNGLLLRADIHTLFDCHLLGIDPNSRKIVTADTLKSSSYAKFSGRVIRAPHDPTKGPSKSDLLKRFKSFEAFEAYRKMTA